MLVHKDYPFVPERNCNDSIRAKRSTSMLELALCRQRAKAKLDDSLRVDGAAGI